MDKLIVKDMMIIIYARDPLKLKLRKNDKNLW